MNDVRFGRFIPQLASELVLQGNRIAYAADALVALASSSEFAEVSNLARNVEIKARLSNLPTQIDLAQKLCGGWGELIHQVDVFFHCPRGRLKLRLFDDGSGELIFYQRQDTSGPKLSDYVITPTDKVESLRETLTRAYGVLAIVEKERRLFMHGRTRIHVDQVANLGGFLELEVVLEDHEDVLTGQREADRLMVQLGVDPQSLVGCAYVDLLSE